MDEIFQVFVTPATLFVCLAAYTVTYFIRTVLQVAWPAIKAQRLYNELFLPLGPIVNGALLGLMAKTFMWPDLVSKTVWGRVFYGAICGSFSAFVYSRVRSWLSAKAAEVGAANLVKSLPLPPSQASEVADTVEAPIGGKGSDQP